MELVYRIDAHVEAVVARINAIQQRFDEPITPTFGEVLSTLDQPSLPVAPPPPDSPVEMPLPGMSNETDSKAPFDQMIRDAAAQFGIDPSLIMAVIRQESGGNPNATSPVGAMGLMQLMPDTAKGLGVSDAYNPRENIFGGVRYLKGLLDQFGGNISLALAGYNAGPNAVKRHGWRIPPYAETQNYVRNILELYRSYRNKENVNPSPTVK